MSNFIITVGVIFAIAYFLPTIIAFMRDAKDKWWVLILNTIFGLSGLGYAIAMIQAFGPTNQQLRDAAKRARLSEEADRAIVIMERRSREQLEYRS